MCGAVVMNPSWQFKLFLHGAKQVQLALLVKQSFAPGEQVANFVFGQPRDRQPMARGISWCSAYNGKPRVIHTKDNRSDFSQISKCLGQCWLHPRGVRRQNGAALPQHRPHHCFHARQL